MAPAALETVKRGPTMNSWIDEEGIPPSPIKKYKVDEGGNISDCDSSDENISDLKPEPELDSEPEWGFDSYEGREYISDPEYRQFCENEDDYQQFRLRRMEEWKGRGFVEDRFNGICSIGVTGEPFGRIIPALVSLCVDKLNEENGTTVECVSIEKANYYGGGRIKFYITFMAQECHGGPLVEYQAKAVRYCRNHKPPIPILCRPTPKSTDCSLMLS